MRPSLLHLPIYVRQSSGSRFEVLKLLSQGFSLLIWSEGNALTCTQHVPPFKDDLWFHSLKLIRKIHSYASADRLRLRADFKKQWKNWEIEVARLILKDTKILLYIFVNRIHLSFGLKQRATRIRQRGLCEKDILQTNFLIYARQVNWL